MKSGFYSNEFHLLLTSYRKSRSRADPQDTSSRLDSGRDRTPTGRDNSMTGSSSSARPPVTSTSTGSSYSSYKTGEERAAFIKQQAEQRMAERLAALGLKAPTKLGESTQQRHDREAKEREERRRQAEAEDVRRDQERQQRLEDEQPSAPTSMKTPSKKPQPPPPRKTRADSVDQKAEAKRKADEEALLQKAEQEGKERAIKEQQKIQEDETKHIEYVDNNFNLPHRKKLTIMLETRLNAKKTSLPENAKLLR